MTSRQLDLFGWYKWASEQLAATTGKITVQTLTDALIKYFGPLVATHPNLVGDDWTVCETLVTIHKVFTREQLQAVSPKVWRAAWANFEAFYLTKRRRSEFYRPWQGSKLYDAV